MGARLRSSGRALVVLALATACTSATEEGSPTSPGSPPAADLAFCVEDSNRARAQNGLSPLSRSSGLEQFAAAGAELDHMAGVAHTHFGSSANSGIALAENELLRWSFGGSIQSIMAQGTSAFVAEGPGGGHHRNLMGNYSQMGCGVFSTGGQTTVVWDFR